MTDLYNAILELSTREPDETILDKLHGYGPVLADSGWQTTNLTLSLPARTLAEALSTALALAASATTTPVRSAQVMTTGDFDRRWPLTPMPGGDAVTVRQAADILGVSPQAVRERLGRGTLPGTRNGRDWQIPRSAVEGNIAPGS